MASKKKKFGKKREFLNPKDGVAAASYEVEVVDGITDCRGWPTLESDAHLELSDCSRKIELEFNLWLADGKAESLKQIKDRRAKLKRLQEIVNGFIEATNASYDYVESKLDEYHAARKAYDAKQKKKKKK